MKVLAIDDNQLNLKLIDSALGSHGHEVRLLEQPADAVAVALEFQPELVLLDIEMPNRNGVEVMRDLRRCPGLTDIPIYAFTAMESEMVAAYVNPGEFTGVVRKPYSLRGLLALLAEAQKASA